MGYIINGIKYNAIFPVEIENVLFQFSGGYDATPNTPPSATTGDVYLITGSGVFGGFTWIAGQHLAWYDGTDWHQTNALASSPIVSVNGKIGAVVLNTSDISAAGSANKYTTQSDIDKLATIEPNAQANLSALETKVLYESNANTNAFTDALKTKLESIQGDYFKGVYVTQLELETAFPTTVDGAYAIVTSTDTIWIYDIVDGWQDTLSNSSGDMLKVTYDPQGKLSDVYDMDNMDEGTINKILTQAERDNIATNTTNTHTHTNKDVLDKIPDNTGVTEGYILKQGAGDTLVWDEDGGGVNATFTGLTDTPINYTGQAGKLPKVNLTEDSLVFDTINWDDVQSKPSIFIKDVDTMDDIVDGTTYVKSTNDFTDILKSKLENITNPMLFKGSITTNAEFPLLADVQNGWVYTISANVTDDDVSKTNTGLSFLLNDEIAWNGTTWIVIGATDYWTDDGTDIYTNNTRNINLKDGGLKDTNITTPINLGDATNTSFATSNKTIVGAVNEIVESSIYKSYGIVSAPTITKEIDTSITISGDGIISFNTQADGLGSIESYTLAQQNIPLTPNVVNYVYASYNAGSPVYEVTTNATIFATNATYSPVVRATVEFGRTHFTEYDEYGIALSNKILFKDIQTNSFTRTAGLSISEKNTRELLVSLGQVTIGVENYTIPLFDSLVNPMYQYYKVGGVWQSSLVTALDSTFYCDGTNRLTLSNNKYVAKYIFRDVGDDLESYYINGNEKASVEECRTEDIPALPTTLLAHAIYVGKIVYQKDATTGTVFTRTWGQTVQSTSPTAHNDLGDIELAGTGVTYGHISDSVTTEVLDLKISGMVDGNLIDSTSVKQTLENMESLTNIVGEPTGFTSPESVIVTYDSLNRTIALTGTVSAYYRGKQVTAINNTYVSTPHPNALDKQYFLIHNGTSFQWLDLTSDSVDFKAILIAYVNYGTNAKWAIRECHGLMQWQSHRADHKNVGTYRDGGGTLADYLSNSSIATDKRPSISATQLYDEDVPTLNPLLPTGGLYTTAYLTGTGNFTFNTDVADIVPLSGNNPYYNQFTGGTWQQTLIGNRQYMAVWLLAIPVTTDTNSQKYRYIWVQGQSVSDSLVDIKARTVQELNKGDFELLAPESLFMAKVILYYQSGNWTIVEVENITGSRANQVQSPSGLYLSSVSSDDTISGIGTSNDPLSVPDLAKQEFYTLPTASALIKTLDGTVTFACKIGYHMYSLSSYRTGYVKVLTDGSTCTISDNSDGEIGDSSDISFTASMSGTDCNVYIANAGGFSYTIKLTIQDINY